VDERPKKRFEVGVVRKSGIEFDGNCGFGYCQWLDNMLVSLITPIESIKVALLLPQVVQFREILYISYLYILSRFR